MGACDPPAPSFLGIAFLVRLGALDNPTGSKQHMSTQESWLPGSWSGVGSSQDILPRPWRALSVDLSVLE